MRKYICDLCKREIEPKDIRVELKLQIENKEEAMDMHSLCYYTFLREVKSILEGEE